MLSRQRLFWRLRPYDLPGSDRVFLQACRDNCAYHIRHCPGYAAVIRAGRGLPLAGPVLFK